MRERLLVTTLGLALAIGVIAANAHSSIAEAQTPPGPAGSATPAASPSPSASAMLPAVDQASPSASPVASPAASPT